MALPPDIPDSIRQEIAIYLGADERILKVISSMSERIEAVGEVWLILTNLSVFFFTRRHGREPVVALLARKDIREIEYFEKISGIVLTFVPERNPASSTRLSFPLSRKEALEDFCEDLADLIKFKKETPAGVKSYKQPSEPVASKKEKAGAKSTPAAKPPAEEKLRIVQSAPKPSNQNKAPGDDSASAVSPDNKVFESKSTSVRSDQEFDSNSTCVYVMLATFISILVGFIWYKFFSALVAKK